MASSRIRIRGFFNNARAIAIRCRCPPERVTPLSPTAVWYPAGNEEMNACAFACFAASTSFFRKSKIKHLMTTNHKAPTKPTINFCFRGTRFAITYVLFDARRKKYRFLINITNLFSKPAVHSSINTYYFRKYKTLHSILRYLHRPTTQNPH